jgi:hypothetical protein
MENRWVWTWLIAPFLSPMPLPIEACGLYWLLLDEQSMVELESSTTSAR